MAVKAKPKWFKSIWVTVAQISQMVVGVITTVLGFFLGPRYNDGECYLTNDNNAAAMAMYGSYLALFVEFFLERYYFKASAEFKKRGLTRNELKKKLS